jgi:hypothetical protein
MSEKDLAVRSHNDVSWNNEGARAAIRAQRPREFIKQYLLPLFFRKTKASSVRNPQRSIDSEKEFWAHTDEILHRIVSLIEFRVTDWFPRSPGIFWTPRAEIARSEVYGGEPENDPELGPIYTPQSKMSLIEGGGIGTVRLRPRAIDGNLCWLATAVKGGHCHAGIPLAIPDSLVQNLPIEWGETADITGHVRFLQDSGLEDIARELRDVRPILLVVDGIKGVSSRRKLSGQIVITPVALFQTENQYDRFSYSFVQCPAGNDTALAEATEWIEKYSSKHDGRVITNFDEQRPILADAPLSYQRLVKKTYDKGVLSEFTGATIIQHVDTLEHNFAHGAIHMGHNINVSGPAIVAIDSTLNNVTQTVTTAAGLDSDQKSKLESMVASLKTQIDGIKGTHPDEAQEIATAVEKAITHASKPPEQRKKSMLELSAKGLKDAAETVKDVAPGILSTASLIANFVTSLR